MSAFSLFDLTPALHVMLMGATVALGPLSWVWLRNRDALPGRRLHILTLITLFLTFDLVLFGAFTRLTDSGLGCPDWPGCYGHASPVGAQVHIEAAQTALPSGPVTHVKAWIEMIHRYLATAVGVLILTLVIKTWLERRRLHISPAWAIFTLLWVCVQGAFGALTVTMKLFPAVVTLHLLGGMVLLVLLKIQALQYAAAASGTDKHLQEAMPRATRIFLAVTFALLVAQVALGGWVSSNYAVLACTEFPACQGSLWPEMDFQNAFSVWRELGSDGSGGQLSFQALTAIHYVHRLFAYVVFTALLLLAFMLHRLPALRRYAHWLLALAGFQLASGLATILFGWPLLAAVAHTGGAAAFLVVLTELVFGPRNAVDAAPASILVSSRLSA